MCTQPNLPSYSFPPSACPTTRGERKGKDTTSRTKCEPRAVSLCTSSSNEALRAGQGDADCKRNGHIQAEAQKETQLTADPGERRLCLSSRDPYFTTERKDSPGAMSRPRASSDAKLGEEPPLLTRFSAHSTGVCVYLVGFQMTTFPNKRLCLGITDYNC